MGNKNEPLDEYAEGVDKMQLAEEQVNISKERSVDARYRIHRTTHVNEELLEAELSHDEVDIRHVAINQVLGENASPQVRQDGDVLIIPVIEEQVEIVRRNVLKEEIHIHKRSKTENFRQSITLRNQEVTIEKEET